jgi:putative transposase
MGTKLIAWQVKYGAFSVRASQLNPVAGYIKRQEQHHRKMSYEEEFLALLDKNGVVYDPRFLWE